jgi:hypothetical protein
MSDFGSFVSQRVQAPTIRGGPILTCHPIRWFATEQKVPTEDEASAPTQDKQDKVAAKTAQNRIFDYGA